MISIVHPLSDELLLGLVASGPIEFADERPERDTSWHWMVIAVLAIGALAWVTR